MTGAAGAAFVTAARTGGRFVAVAGCPPFISPPVFPESGLSTTCGGDRSGLRILWYVSGQHRPVRRDEPCPPEGRVEPFSRSRPPGGGGLAYISQQRPAARRRSAGREARGCSRRAEPWPVSGGARRGGAGRGRCSPQGPVRAAPGAGCGPGRRGVAEQRLPRGSLGGGEPRV